MFPNFHVCVMVLFNAMLYAYMLVRYSSPSSPMCLGALNFIYHALWSFFALFYCLLNMCCGEWYFVCFHVHVFVLCIFCLAVLVKHSLNAFAICVGVACWCRVCVLYYVVELMIIL